MPSFDDDQAVQVWNMMGGQIDWNALPVLVEMLGVEDVEMMIRRLLTIREFKGRG